MDNKEISEVESLELRISEMKSQFQKSYEVFLKAHEELSKISFDPSVFRISGESLGPLAQLEAKDVNEILEAGSIDECLSTLRSKVDCEEKEKDVNTFPDVSKLLRIMNGLQTDLQSMSENQKQFSKLSADVNVEMSLFEKRMEDSMSQLEDAAVESTDGSDASRLDECWNEEEEETFGSESFSD